MNDLFTVDCLHIESLKENNVLDNLKPHILVCSVSISEIMKGHAGELIGALKPVYGTQVSHSKMSSALYML